MIRRMFVPLLLLVFLQTGSPASQSESGNGTVASFDGVEVAYETRGQGEPTIVFVHGWANNRSVWRDQLRHFSNRYQVVAMDLPGFGKSGNDREDWTMAAYGRDVKAVVDAVKAEKPLVLVGFSMGTSVVIEAARLLPEKVIGIVLVDQLHDPEQKFPPPVVAHVDSMFMDIIHNPAPEKMMMFYRHNPEESYRRVLTMIQDVPTVGWRDALAEYHRWRNEEATAALDAVDVPVVAINSDYEPTNAEAYRKYVPSFKVHVIPDVGHLVMWDATAKFNELLEASIQGFLNE